MPCWAPVGSLLGGAGSEWQASTVDRSVKTGPANPPRPSITLPPPRYDEVPSFLMYAGLVFVPLTVSPAAQPGPRSRAAPPPREGSSLCLCLSRLPRFVCKGGCPPTLRWRPPPHLADTGPLLSPYPTPPQQPYLFEYGDDWIGSAPRRLVEKALNGEACGARRRASGGPWLASGQGPAPWVRWPRHAALSTDRPTWFPSACPQA
jgi:hypothetical protein